MSLGRYGAVMPEIPAQPVPAGRERPTVVTVASGLLVLLVLLLLVNTIVGILGETDEVRRATEEFGKLQGGSSVPQGLTGACTVVAALAFGAAFLILAFLNLRGNQPARIVTWVVCGIGVLFCVCGVLFQGVLGSLVGAAGEEQRE